MLQKSRQPLKKLRGRDSGTLPWPTWIKVSTTRLLLSLRDWSRTSYGIRARQQLQVAVNHAARETRKQAAEHFYKARNTQDPAVKRSQLEESRRLLESILQKYPQADVVGKVTRNLRTIEAEIAKLDAAAYPPAEVRP